MANTTVNLVRETIGKEGYTFDLPVDGGTKIYEGSLVSQLTGTGQAVPYSTASSGVCVGVATHTIDNTSGNDGDKRVRVETKRMFVLKNGTAGDAFSDTSLIGSVVYGSDDNTVADNSNSAARKAVGFFMGMESDGRVRVFVDPPVAALVNALATLTDAPATADALRDNIVAQLG